MARPRDFELEPALDAAVASFWQHGYAATSVRQLCEAMGIQAGSFYAAFGSKDACFRQAIARYVATQPLPREPSPAAIRRWFDAITDPKRRPKGCLLVHAAIEHPNLDEDTRALVHAKLRAMQAFFVASLAGRPNADADAALLHGTVLSIHVLARAGTPAKTLRQLADTALAATSLGR